MTKCRIPECQMTKCLISKHYLMSNDKMSNPRMFRILCKQYCIALPSHNWKNHENEAVRVVFKRKPLWIHLQRECALLLFRCSFNSYKREEMCLRWFTRGAFNTPKINVESWRWANSHSPPLSNTFFENGSTYRHVRKTFTPSITTSRCICATSYLSSGFAPLKFYFTHPYINIVSMPAPTMTTTAMTTVATVA